MDSEISLVTLTLNTNARLLRSVNILCPVTKDLLYDEVSRHESNYVTR